MKRNPAPAAVAASAALLAADSATHRHYQAALRPSALPAEPRRAQEQLAKRIVAEGISVRATEELVALALADGPAKTPAAKRRPKAHAPALTDLADRLSDRFDTRVKVDIGRSKGKITIEFATVDDLERIVGIIGVGQEEQPEE